jgi:hypothetical protein
MCLHLPPHEQIQQQPAEDDGTFDEINNHYIDENVNRAADGEAENPAVNVATVADAELTLYKQASTLKLRQDDGACICPLTWWKYKEHKYKLLSILASSLLCLPATSAPLEHVFSVVGLTIAPMS